MNSNYWYLILGFLGLAILITTIILAFFIEATYIIPLIPASGTFMGLGFVGCFYRLSNPTKFRKEQVAEQDEC